MRQRISASTRQFLEKTKATELVGEAKEKRLLSSVSKYPRKLTWRQRTDRSELLSPFGLIEVWADDGFIVLRNDAPLFHPTCRAVSVFLTRDSAQAAAELHCWLGWGDYEREPDCLAFEWDDAWCREPVITRQPVPSPVDDKFVRPGWELQDRSEPWGYPFGVAQSERGWFDKQIPHLGAQRLCWQGFNGQPAWTRATQGWFNLATPYGELVVRRHGDCWVTERNGRPLCYGPGAGDEAERPDGKRPRGLADLQLVFGDYRDAQTLALLWAFPLGRDNILHWSDGPPAMAAA